MLSIKRWKCSWSLAAAIASIVALVSVVHLFLFPLGPSFDFLRQSENFCIPVNGSSQDLRPAADLDHRFPAGLHKEVIYRGAPWKAEIGRWLSGCDSITKDISTVEIIGGSNCKNDCSGQGICNRELGQCRCFHGYSGEGCSERLQLQCNYPQSPELPYGRWVVSMCPAYCDTTRAMCFCGEGTKYPNRPMPETCGFKVNLPSEPGAPKVTDWAKGDLDNVFTTNGSKPGWCNVDPAEAYAQKVKFKEECNCVYDCLSGRFCEVPVLCICINQCSGHGHCRGGFCQCDNGWYGIDCSIPSVISSVREWPQWLRPAQVNVPDDIHLRGKVVNLNAMVKKKRPLIYVYDLPPDFNSLLLEGRHFKLECVNRIYDDNNATVWTDQLYGAQMALYESILASPHRTLNGEEADFFFVPVLDACIITRADDAPHLSMQDHMGLRSYLTLEFYKKAYDHIVEQFPYWNRSSGRDHIWSFSWDEGACYAPKEIWNSMMLVHWGNTNSKHKHSTTAYWADNWDTVPSSRRGNHPCFEPDKDLVLPAWKRPDVISLGSKLWARPREKRKTLFYFNGNLGPAYPRGRPEASYSMGIRQKIAEEFGSSPNKEGKLGKQHAEDVIVTPLRSNNYHEDLASSVFCGVFPGDGWSGRMEDSILQGCIPVVIQDGIFLPYENVLNYDSFAVRIREDEIPNMIKILRGFDETEIEYKLANVRKTWQRFLYRDSIMLEAERQKSAFGRVEDWAQRKGQQPMNELLTMESDESVDHNFKGQRCEDSCTQASENQRGIRRRCLQFEEAPLNFVGNRASSLDPTDKVTNSRSPATTAELEGLESPTDINAASSKGEMFKLSQSRTTYLPQYRGNSPLTVPKPSGIGLHLNSIVSAVPLGHGAIADLKPAEGHMSSAVISCHSLESATTCPISFIAEDGKDKSKSSVAASSAPSESPNSKEPLNLLKPVEHHATPHDKRKFYSEHDESYEYCQLSPKKKRKKTSSTIDSDGCKRCNCKKTKCLKLYCDCFAAGIYCAEPCACQGCFNRPEYEDTVLEIRQQIESRNPLAFAPKILQPAAEINNGEDGNRATPSSGRHKRGCNCKKSMCLKKYCECYQANVGCSSGCRCDGCKNVYGRKEEYVATEHGVNKEMVSDRAGEKRFEGTFDEKLEMVATKKDFLHPELYDLHNLTPLTPSFDCSDHGRPDRKSQPFSRRYLQSPESDLAILSSYVDSTKSSRTLDSSDMRLQTNKELLNVGCYDWQVNYNNAEIVDQFSPSNDAVANMCHLTPLSDPPLTSMSSSTSSKTTGWINISQVQPSPGTGYVSSGGSLHWRSSPITPMARLDGTKSVQGLDPDGGLCEILEDETPEILKDSATPIKPVKVSSPNQKRVSPPKSHLHELESSSSGGLRSGRKFILKAVPSFPPLTPCIDSKGGTNLKAINFQDNNSSK